MKICILIPSLSGGGAEFVAREWAAWLAFHGHAVSVAVTRDEDASYRPVGFEVLHLSGATPVGHVLAMRRLVQQRSFDVVLGLLPYFNLLAILGAIGQKNRPKVAISGRNVEMPFPHVHGKNVFLTRLLSRLLYPSADEYVAISHPVAAEAGAMYRIPSNKITVIPNPASGKSLRAISARTQSVGESSPLHLNLIVPARIAQQKRPLLVIDVARALKKRGYHVSVHFFGDGDLRASVEASAIAKGIDITIHGWDEEWFTKVPAGVVILTSIAEGFGNVLVEAASVGLPSVVSSRCLGSADAVVPGVTGELAAGDAADDYATAVVHASTLKVRGPAVESWLDRFSVESSGNAIEALLARMVGGDTFESRMDSRS